MEIPAAGLAKKIDFSVVRVRTQAKPWTLEYMPMELLLTLHSLKNLPNRRLYFDQLVIVEISV